MRLAASNSTDRCRRLSVFLAVVLATTTAASQPPDLAESLADVLTKCGFGIDRCDVDAVRNLLQAGASPNVPAKSGFLPLLSASLAASGNPKALEVMDLLVSGGADVNAVSSGVGMTALMAAATNGAPEVITRLLDKGADVNVGRKGGETALYHSTRRGTFLVAEVLIRRGADVNTSNAERVTPLHMASLNGMKSVVILLLEKGAYPNARDDRGKTPLAWAKGHRFDDYGPSGDTQGVIEILLKHGAVE